jgi:hypothetical protein
MTNRKQSIASWMASVVIGTYLGAWGFATMSALLKGGVVRWVVLMAFASGLAAVQVVLLGMIDTILLWLHLRKLPNGRNAWIGSMLSMAIVLGTSMGWPLTSYITATGLIFGVVMPLILVPVVIRLVLGERCDA